MLIVLTISLVLVSVLILFTKKTIESMYLFGICFSLMLQIIGVTVFIAKKGGISDEVLLFLFISKFIQNKIRYMYITLNLMGYIIALGRSLFPMFLLKLAFRYSMVDFVKKNYFIRKAVCIIPIITLIIYEPHVYRAITEKNIFFAKFILNSSKIWISLYLIAAIGLLLYEYFSITMKLCKRQFSSIIISMCALTGIYYLYYKQDPGQVYRFYDYTFSWGNSIGYMQIKPSLISYLTLVLVSLICCILGFYSFLNFTAGRYIVNKENLVLQRKFDTAKVGASMFVHGMKNQLLASRVIFKRINGVYADQEPDIEKLKGYTATLEEINNSMYERIEELHNSIKQNVIYMKPVELKDVIDTAIDKFHKKYPEVSVKTDIRSDSMVLVDKIPFCEALGNLLLNGYEAIVLAERDGERDLSVICYNERLYTVIEIKDNGIGIKKKDLKKVFYPFYSNKNSKTNWGMGLYYVKETVKSHYGLMRIESKDGEGSSFFIMLPKFG